MANLKPRRLRLFRIHGLTIKIDQVKWEGFLYEWRIKIDPVWRISKRERRSLWVGDPTSHRNLEAAISAAKEVAVWYALNKPYPKRMWSVPDDRLIPSKRKKAEFDALLAMAKHRFRLQKAS